MTAMPRICCCPCRRRCHPLYASLLLILIVINCATTINGSPALISENLEQDNVIPLTEVDENGNIETDQIDKISIIEESKAILLTEADQNGNTENDQIVQSNGILVPIENGNVLHDHHHQHHNLVKTPAVVATENDQDHLRPRTRQSKNKKSLNIFSHNYLLPKIIKKLRRIEHYDASTLVANANELQVLIDYAIDWAHSNGLILRTRDHLNTSDLAEFAPFSLFPTPFPRKIFNQALNVQTAMQLLYFRISKDFEFLKTVHQDIIKTDKVVKSFMEIVEKVYEEGIHQPITLFFQRSDYMLHSSKNDQSEDNYALKQIEVNGSALGGAGLVTRVTRLHRRMLKKAGIEAPKSNVPDNGSDVMTAKALFHAWQVFGKADAVLLFLVDTNADMLQFDRRNIQYEFERVSKDQVDVVRLSLTQCTAKLMLDPVDFSLRLVDDGRVIAVVFNQVLMLGSSPSHMELDARLMIERSTAIKAPSLVFAMSHSKKIQQVLTRPGMVERFLSGPSEAHLVDKIRQTFAGLWGFEADKEKNDQLIQMAIKHPDRYVLKPIGEGCGAHFNYFDEDIPKKLAQLSPIELNDFILMERLKPKAYRNHFVRAFLPPMINAEVTSELGIYGCLLGNISTGQVLLNRQEGHVSKSKLLSSNEGGICSGTGMIDTPYLVDID
ncbi:hypothetical protein niasHT_029457 [Heterodera trifolii]|uniref:Glutathione synthetase n=1 Tax=Heterodera trifolii TaxID=157864 RepID=A0ABD2KQ55_9BILA